MNTARLTTMRIIHLIFMATVVIYGVILRVLKGTATQGPSSRTMNLDPHLLGQLATGMTVVYVVGLVIYHNALKYRLPLSPNGVSPTGAYQTSQIVGLAFAESGPVYGVVLVLMGAPMEWYYYAAALGLLVMAGMFPSEKRFNEFSARVTGRLL